MADAFEYCYACDYFLTEHNAEPCKRCIEEERKTMDKCNACAEKAKPLVGINPEIIVTGSKENPYFLIRYFDTEDKCLKLGYGSYNIAFVFEWLQEFFGLSNARAVEAEPVKHGRWKCGNPCNHKPYRIKNTDKWTTYRCSECGYSAGRHHSYNYCPNCGAKMDGDGNDTATAKD